MKQYEQLKFQVLLLEAEDVITASTADFEGGDYFEDDPFKAGV